MPGLDGEMLRAWRRSRGWDVPELARQFRRAARESGVSVAVPAGLIRMIYAWERGDHDLSERYELLYRTLGLGTGGAAPQPGSPGTLGRQEPGRARLDALSPGQIDELIRLLDDQWHVLVRTDNLLGPRHALGGVLGQLGVIEALLRTARPPARHQVLHLAARYAESAAWLHEDAGDLPGSRHWTGRSMEWALEAGDRLMMSWVLYRRGEHAAADGDAAAAASLAAAARREGGDLPGPMLAAISQQEACAHALDGAEAACLAALDQALERAASPDDPGDASGGHGSFCTPAYVEMQRGRCWLRLGRCARRPRRARRGGRCRAAGPRGRPGCRVGENRQHGDTGRDRARPPPPHRGCRRAPGRRRRTPRRLMASFAEAAAMRRAIALSAAGLGTTSPNPPVGCVLLSPSGRIVGEGYHQRKGEAHAEAQALAAAGPLASGATAVVTLEPCNHQGRTPPCRQALIDAGIRRAVVAVIDPTSRGKGGVAELRRAGVDVETGVLAGEAEIVLGDWLAGLRDRHPVITWPYIVTAEGLGQLPADTREARELRLNADAVLGADGTVREAVPGSHGKGILALGEVPPGDGAAVAAALYDGGVRLLLLDGGLPVAVPFLDAGVVDRAVAFLAYGSASSRPAAEPPWPLLPPGFAITGVTRTGNFVRVDGQPGLD